MSNPRMSRFVLGALFLLTPLVFATCTGPNKGESSKVDTKPTTPSTKPPVAQSSFKPIRIKAGADAPITDAKGNVWAPESSPDVTFDGGSVIDRPDLNVTGTDIPEIFHSEHYSMNSVSIKVPNGDYMLNLYFSEDYDGIADQDGRIFDYAVKDGDPTNGTTKHEVKQFSPWKAAGDHYKAYVDKVPITVTKGAISVVFTPGTENPQINALEVTAK